MSLTVLGISALYHDSAAVIVRDGEIVAAAQEERFTRKKADASIPTNAIKYCVEAVDRVDKIVYYDNPFLTLDRWLTNCVMVSPDNDIIVKKSYPKMLKRLWIKEGIKEILGRDYAECSFAVCEHHVSHAASAYYPSPFDEAAILTMDGVGEWATTTIGKGSGNKIVIEEQINYPDSLGLLYSAFTYFCGFKVNFGEYKLMGLAPYGEARYIDIIKNNLITIHEDGSFKLNQDFFSFLKDEKTINSRFDELFGFPKREPESVISKQYMDLSASIQAVTEEVVVKLARHAKRITNCNKLCLAGGIALNCVANGRIVKEKIFDDVWIQPAAGDAGGALGCALYYTYNNGGIDRNSKSILVDSMKGSYLGPKYSCEYIKGFLDDNGVSYHFYDESELYKKIAIELVNNKVIGLYQGRMEFGPRALGNRSIIANPMADDMQSRINLKIKYRESFRPFAPSVLEEKAEEYFDIDCISPYMLLTAPIKNKYRNITGKVDNTDNIYDIVRRKRSYYPAITHVDYSARIQTVNKKTNPYFYNVIQEFEKITGCPMLVNTSFNVRGEPIVCTPEDSWMCFTRTEMDVLILENFIIYKDEQSIKKEKVDWRNIYELD